MHFHPYGRFTRSSKSSRRKARARRVLVPPQLEVLEDRVVLSGVAPQLVISGNDYAEPGRDYILNLTAISEHAISEWFVDWGDGSDPDGDGNVGEIIPGDASFVTHVFGDTVKGQTLNIAAAATNIDGTFPADASMGSSLASSFIIDDPGTVPDETGGLVLPREILFGPDGYLYVANSANSGTGADNVLRYDAAGNFVDTVISTGPLDWAYGLTFGPDGALYASGWLSDNVVRHDLSTGVTTEFVAAGSGGLDGPAGITFGPDGSLFVSAWNTHEVLRFDGQTGTYLERFVTDDPATGIDETGGLDTPVDVEFGPNGQLYVAGHSSFNILRYDGMTGTLIDEFATEEALSSTVTNGFVRPFAMEFGPSGDLFVATSYLSEAVVRLDGQTGKTLETLAPPLAQTPDQEWPIGVTIDLDGNLYVSGGIAGNADAPPIISRVPLAASGAQLPVAVLDPVNYASGDVPQRIRNESTIISTLEIVDDFEIFDVNLRLDIDHQKAGDLSAHLTSPDGTRLKLFGFGGVVGNSISGEVVLDDETDRFIHLAGWSGTVQPDGQLWDFDRQNAKGTWILEVTDLRRPNQGMLNAWSLDIRGVVPPPPPPTLSINDVSVTEGDSGPATATFTVTRSGDTSDVVTVDYATADGTALAGSDYDGISTTQLVFNAGETAKMIEVTVNGDDVEEADETFFVNLSNISANATITDGQGVGTIVDDDTVATGPSILSLSPDSASPGDQLTVTISGTGFVDGATVDFGQRVTVQSVTYISDSELVVVIKVHPKASLGFRDVTVRNPDGSSDTLTDGFTIGTASAATSSQSFSGGTSQTDLTDDVFSSDLDAILDS